MTIKDTVDFARKLDKDIKTKKVRVEEKYLPKAGAYISMIIDRGEIIIKDTQRMNKFMEDINDGLKRLQSYGIQLPSETNELPKKANENPLK